MKAGLENGIKKSLCYFELFLLETVFMSIDNMYNIVENEVKL